MYISYDKHGIIKMTSMQPIHAMGRSTIKTDQFDSSNYLVGKRVVLGKRSDKLRIALIVNWGDKCGISTYTENLTNALRPKVQEVKIFSEHIANVDAERDKVNNVVRCWRRGESMVPAIKAVLDWRPDLVFIQHEFGIFPKATHFLKMLEMLNDTPYVITLHSVYEHLDKTICTAYIKAMIVHSEAARESLFRNGHRNNIHVIYHGCVEYPDNSELWNIFQNDYAVIQFGFGFNYKGVDMAIDAISHLKRTQEKFKDIFYCYLCTESPHTKSIQQEYYNHLSTRVAELGLEDNVAIMRGFLSEQHVCNFLRTAKLAIFPYRNDEKNIVYGASGAIRNAMANAVPVIASDCHHFDEFDGVLPRVKDSVELSQEIDKVFSDQAYRDALVERCLNFVKQHSWDKTADQHLAAFRKVIDANEADLVRVENYEVIG
jgi:glycosyltransferase involved in cell wall biosynthesis